MLIVLIFVEELSQVAILLMFQMISLPVLNKQINLLVRVIVVKVLAILCEWDLNSSISCSTYSTSACTSYNGCSIQNTTAYTCAPSCNSGEHWGVTGSSGGGTQYCTGGSYIDYHYCSGTDNSHISLFK